MTRKTIIGLLSILVITSTSSPIYAEFMSPLKQINDGIANDMIQCNTGKVLVESSSGKAACVYDSTAKKLENRGWKIIENHILLVEYVFPLIAKQTEKTSTQNVESLTGSYSKIELQISNLPKLGESAEITGIVIGNFGDDVIIGDPIEDYIRFNISHKLQVVTGIENFTETIRDQYGYSSYLKEISLYSNEPQIFKITVVALGDGETRISAKTVGDDFRAKSSFDLVIGENETLLKDDYYKKYPAKLAEKEAVKETAKQLALEEERLEEERLLAHGCQFIEKIGMFCPPTDEEIEAMRNDTNHGTIGDTEEDLRAYLKADGATDEEIEEIVRKVYPKAFT